MAPPWRSQTPVSVHSYNRAHQTIKPSCLSLVIPLCGAMFLIVEERRKPTEDILICDKVRSVGKKGLELKSNQHIQHL